MRKLDNLKGFLKKFVIVPRVNFYGGFKYDGEDIDLCDDTAKEGEDYIRVRQSIRGHVLETNLEKSYTMKSGKRITETTHQEVELEEDQLLVYVEGAGFVIPEYNMCEVDEAIAQYEILKFNEVKDDETTGNEKESPQADRGDINRQE